MKETDLLLLHWIKRSTRIFNHSCFFLMKPTFVFVPVISYHILIQNIMDHRWDPLAAFENNVQTVISWQFFLAPLPENQITTRLRTIAQFNYTRFTLTRKCRPDRLAALNTSSRWHLLPFLKLLANLPCTPGNDWWKTYLHRNWEILYI